MVKRKVEGKEDQGRSGERKTIFFNMQAFDEQMIYELTRVVALLRVQQAWLSFHKCRPRGRVEK